MSTTSISSTQSSTHNAGNNTQSIQRIDQNVLCLAKEWMFRNQDVKVSQKVYAYGELVTDFSALLRSISGLAEKGTSAINPMGIGAGANTVLGGIYLHNGNEIRKDSNKVGNNKEKRNGIILMMKGVALVIYGIVSVIFRSLGMAGASEKTMNVTGHVFTGTGLALFTIAFLGVLVKVMNVFALKMKMFLATFNPKTRNFAEFAVISKKLLALPSQKSIDREIAKFNKLKPEEKTAFKNELKTWIENAQKNGGDTSDFSGELDTWENKLAGAVSDEDLRSLYVAVRIGTRKQQKLLAHFGGRAEKLAEVSKEALEILSDLDRRAQDLNFENFFDLLNHAKKNTDSAKHNAAVGFLKNDVNHADLTERVKGVVKETHSALNQSMKDKLWGIVIYGLGIALWILGMIVAVGTTAAMVVTGLWIVISVATIYLDGKDLWQARNHEMIDRKERIAMLAISVIAAVAAVLAIVLSVGTGGLAPLLFSAALAVCYLGLFAYAYYKRNNNNGYLPVGADGNIKTKTI